MYKSIQENKETWHKNGCDSINNFKSHIFSPQLNDNDLLVIQKLMHYNYKQISASQIRNTYNLMLDKNNQSVGKRIKLAYIAGRTDKKKEAMLVFLEKLDGMLKTDFLGVESFAEACLAYHKYYENLGISYKDEKKKTESK